MVQTACGLGFVHEAQAEFLFLFGLLSPERNGLDRDEAVDLRISGLVDNAHSSATEFTQDLVAAKMLELGLFHRLSLQRDPCPQGSLGRDSYYVSVWAAVILELVRCRPLRW